MIISLSYYNPVFPPTINSSLFANTESAEMSQQSPSSPCLQSEGLALPNKNLPVPGSPLSLTRSSIYVHSTSSGSV